METDLAKAAMDIVSAPRSQKTRTTKCPLQQDRGAHAVFQLEPLLLSLCRRRPRPSYIVIAPGFFRGMEKMVQSHSNRTMAGLSALVDSERVGAFAESAPFVDENFDFFGRTLGGTKRASTAPGRRCSIYADTDLGEGRRAGLRRQILPPGKTKERMLQMVKAIKNALDQDIDGATWMSVRNQESGARPRLAAQVDKIGYPRPTGATTQRVEIKRNDFLGKRGSVHPRSRSTAALPSLASPPTGMNGA